jgi:hypothetical protein
MIIKKEISINKSIQDVWEVLGNQFGEISVWSSLIKESKVYGDSKIKGLNYSIRETNTVKGITKQEMTSFNPEQHSLSYKALSGTPSFIKGVNAKWFLSKLNDNSTQLTMSAAIETKGIMGIVLGPVVKIKFGKLGDELMDDLKYYLENGSPHPRNFIA